MDPTPFTFSLSFRFRQAVLEALAFYLERGDLRATATA
jgi:hypothetical protein